MHLVLLNDIHLHIIQFSEVFEGILSVFVCCNQIKCFKKANNCGLLIHLQSNKMLKKPTVWYIDPFATQANFRGLGYDGVFP